MAYVRDGLSKRSLQINDFLNRIASGIAGKSSVPFNVAFGRNKKQFAIRLYPTSTLRLEGSETLAEHSSSIESIESIWFTENKKLRYGIKSIKNRSQKEKQSTKQISLNR